MKAAPQFFLAFSLACLFSFEGRAAPNTYFTIRVTDEQTGRGVPLVELKTVNKVSSWTDSNGIVAFDEPGLMSQEIFFHVASPGYEYPKDGFDNRGVKLRPTLGGRAEVKLKRLQIAERLYRITGGGIYRDSVLVGARVPLRQPVLNAQVFGQDTVIATPYRGKIYWFWGDTDRASYPLGNFAASGATSDLRGNGGLDPGVGVDLTYFVDASGFSKQMCPNFGPGLHWIESLLTVPDESGRERLAARVSSQKGLMPAYAWHLALFNDERQIFESQVKWEISEGHDSAHPFRARVDGIEYFYLYPNYRVRAELAALRDLRNYEAFTCVAGEGKLRGADTTVEHDGAGRVRYAWKTGADRLHPGRLRELVSNGKLQRGEAWLQLQDIDTGMVVEASRGSVFWNEYMQRWVMICSGKPGEIWFSIADAPTGPWTFARLVATHGRYNFYNPTQHPFFDQDHGRLIYFEGTYTDSFSGAPAKTPRYDYNQIMYRLALDDARLRMPVPVYRVKGRDGVARYLLRKSMEAESALERVEEIVFFAIDPERSGNGLVAIYSDASGAHFQTNAPHTSNPPLFRALPHVSDTSVITTNLAVSSVEVLRDRNGQPLGRVWKNPTKIVLSDFLAPQITMRR